MAGLDLIVNKADWSQCRFEPADVDGDLAANEVLLRVDRFALTSNNISYAAAGDMLDYWGFFPAATPGMGRIPAMGFGDVLRSRHPEVAEGERVFGFFPMSTHLRLQADAITRQGFVDKSEHRAKQAAVYRQYNRTDADAMYEAKYEDETLLLRGLFMTSFLVDDFVADNDFFGARDFVISSASSKTAIALAFLTWRRGRGRVIGLTSARNRAFVEDLGYYDRTLLYEDVGSLAADVPAVFVDHSGNGDVVNAVHRQLGDNLVYSCIVGATHWSAPPRASDLPGANPEFFFAPGQIQKRSQEWGGAVLAERLGGAWALFRDASGGWLRVVRGYGPEQVERVYREVLEGRARPDRGHVLSLWERE